MDPFNALSVYCQNIKPHKEVVQLQILYSCKFCTIANSVQLQILLYLDIALGYIRYVSIETWFYAFTQEKNGWYQICWSCIGFHSTFSRCASSRGPSAQSRHPGCVCNVYQTVMQQITGCGLWQSSQLWFTASLSFAFPFETAKTGTYSKMLMHGLDVGCKKMMLMN